MKMIKASFPRQILSPAFVSAGVLILCVIFYFLLQNNFIYSHSVSRVIKNYQHNNDQIIRTEVPFEKYDKAKMMHWDAQLYMQIRDNGYNIQSAGGDYIFAFFPLFPAIWKLIRIPVTCIIFFNYLLFVTALILIFNCFNLTDKEKRKPLFAVSICVPMLVVFLIPYSEGVFMLAATIALLGIYRDKYALYCIAALLMSMSRPSVLIIGIAVLLTESFFFLQDRKIKASLRSTTLKILPLLAGTFTVSLIQKFYGSDSLFKFIEVQQYWGSQLQLPGRLTDWAHEQFGSNLSLLLLLIPASFVYLGFHSVVHTKRNVLKFRHKSGQTNRNNKEYLFVLSLFFMTCMALSLLFMRGGSLNGISRYILCSPFYFIALLLMREKLTGLKTGTILVFFTIFLLTASSALSLSAYSRSWNFSDTGFVLLVSQLSFFVFPTLAGKKWFVVLHVVLTALWTSYLFNMFISDAWIFTRQTLKCDL